MRRAMILGATLLLLAGNANAVVIGWNGAGGGDGSAGSFNTRTQFFGAVAANTFSWLGGGFFHSHDNSTVVTSTLELQIDSVWTQIDSAVTTTNAQIASNTLSDPSVYALVSFTGGSVTGIRFDSAPFQNITYHIVAGNFELTQVQVPEPVTVALLGLGLVGLGFSRRNAR